MRTLVECLEITALQFRRGREDTQGGGHVLEGTIDGPCHQLRVFSRVCRKQIPLVTLQFHHQEDNEHHQWQCDNRRQSHQLDTERRGRTPYHTPRNIQQLEK